MDHPEGNVVAEYVVNGIHGYIMDTYIRDVPPEEMKKRVEKAKATAQRIWDRYLREHPNYPD
ncbi:MAG: hypothetical protein LUE11_04935 [Clostridia bacterium]|nr:hypothetical protein [Clostridia bacterium]